MSRIYRTFQKFNRSSYNLPVSPSSFFPEASFHSSFHTYKFTTQILVSSSYNSTKDRNSIYSSSSYQTFVSKQSKMDISLMGFDTPFLLHNLHNILEAADDNNKSNNNNNNNAGPTRAYVRDARAMAATPADVKEYPNSYVFIIDMPGTKSGDIKVQIEDDNVLVISGERKRENEENNNGVKYVRMERRIGKFMRKFALPENANTDKISAICQDGVLTVTVEKLPPPEPKKPKMIQVQVA